MKNKTILAILIVLAVAASGYGAYRLGVQHGKQSVATVSSAAAKDQAANGGQADKKPLYWHDPMVPGQKFDKPGKSPFMDMQLVPVYASEDGDDNRVSISPRLQQNLGIRTALVTTGKLAGSITAVGSVAYNERDVALVQARSNGFLERLYVRAPLDPVRKGQALADLYVPDWIAAQEEFLAARRMPGADTGSLVDAARQRMRLAGMNDGQIRLVETTSKVNAHVTISAPTGGIVAELGAREGMTVTIGTPLFRINGLSTVWINAELPEGVAARVRAGDPVEARVQALPGDVYKGKVGAILPEVNSATRTLRARIELANSNGRLVPGMFASLAFGAGDGPEMLMLPSEAVIQTGTRNVVLLAQADGKFLPAEVEIGNEANGFTEIRKGVSAGQKVVVSGQFLVDSEASLKGATARMGEAPLKLKEQDTPRHHGEGKVEQVGKHEVTISHGPIASLQWGPMTMPFKLPPAGAAVKVKQGDQVDFEFKQLADGGFEITALTPVAKPPAAEHQAMPMSMKGQTQIPRAQEGSKK